MGAAAPLLEPVLEALSGFGDDAARPAPEDRLKAARQIWLRGVEDLAARAKSMAGRHATVQAGFERVIAALASEIERGEKPSVDLDDIIHTLQTHEAEIRTELLPALATMEAQRRDTFSLPSTSPGERARAIAASEKYSAAVLAMLETLQDVRWQIMALRAKCEDPGDAPVFDNPHELLKYLEKHR
jgi:hypothetical protein